MSDQPGGWGAQGKGASSGEEGRVRGRYLLDVGGCQELERIAGEVPFGLLTVYVTGPGYGGGTAGMCGKEVEMGRV